MPSRVKNKSDSIGSRIRYLRKLSDLTQRELAAKLSKSESAVRMWELGKSEPDLETVKILSSIFNVSSDVLLDEYDKFDPNENNIFALRLKELRDAINKSQLKVAEELKINNKTYCTYEKGTREPDHETLVQIADYFNVSIDYLLGRTEPQLTPEEMALGITTTATMKLNDEERELIIAYRDLGKKKGATYQLLVREHLNKLLSL